MSLEKVKSLMTQAGWGTLATFNGSDKVAQLHAVPHAEYCFAEPEGRHVRISGPCTISSNADDKRQLYDANPTLKEHIQNPEIPEYVVIRMTPDRIRMMNPTDMEYEEIELP